MKKLLLMTWLLIPAGVLAEHTVFNDNTFAKNGILVADFATDLRSAANRMFNELVVNQKRTKDAQTIDANQTNRVGENIAPPDEHSGQASVKKWQVLKLGQSANGLSFRRVGNDAIVFLDKSYVVTCLKGSDFEGERHVYLTPTLEQLEVHISPVSSTGKYVSVFCAYEAEPAVEMRIIVLQTKAVKSINPATLVGYLQPWISFSPDDKYAVLNQAGDEGNYSALVVNLNTLRAKKIKAPLFKHDENTQPVWINEKSITYHRELCVNSSCDPPDSANFEIKVDVSTLKWERRRLAN